MKKFTNLFVALGVTLFLLTVGMSQVSLSQVLDCEGDPCVNMANCATWVTPAPLVITPDMSCPTCTIKVYYKYRDNSLCLNICPGVPKIEFQIDYILTDGSCFYSCNGNPPQYNFGDMDKLYMIGLFSLVKHYSLPYMVGNCGPLFRNFKGASCKKQYVGPNGNVAILTCQDYECCIQNLQYCINGTQETLIKTDLVVPANNCDDDPDGLPCQFSCLWEWEDSYVPKKAMINENSIDENYILEYQDLENEIVLKLEGNLEGQLNMLMFNNSGQTILNNNFNVNRNKFENIIDNNLVSGTYYIFFSLNGQIIKTQKFNITR